MPLMLYSSSMLDAAEETCHCCCMRAASQSTGPVGWAVDPASLSSFGALSPPLNRLGFVTGVKKSHNRFKHFARIVVWNTTGSGNGSTISSLQRPLWPYCRDVCLATGERKGKGTYRNRRECREPRPANAISATAGRCGRWLACFSGIPMEPKSTPTPLADTTGLDP